ncbi:hypothetical protein F406_gp054 [Agrobacterium phage 7-7-1]|uniref:Uncharacterized protein n=1 Tax=Agrobacterium phage 7-7-1 TaxID=1161931 RepID=J7FAF0_9CAUD|nr:hypothetical protein F406_gp054 [Agrobacterium phage 7-7-1]AFH19761.1 hypothetical protein 7-7-1_00063 [Agrobacterium phage 7-7-1]
MKKLSPAQESIMRNLAKTNGFSQIWGGTPLASYQVLERRGLIKVNFHSPVKAGVEMTDEGKRLFPLKYSYCLKCDEEKPVDEAVCLHCGEPAPWAK